MAKQKPNRVTTFNRPETVQFQVSFDVKDRRGLTRFKGITFGRVVENDGVRICEPLSWRITIQTGYGTPNPFDQFLDATDAISKILDCLKVLRKMFPYCRFNINICYRQNNGSELVRYFTGEYFIMAAYAISTDSMTCFHGVENSTLSSEYYAVRAAASQEEEHLGNSRYAAALKDPDKTEMSYQRLVGRYEQSLRWLNQIEFNRDLTLVLLDIRAIIHCCFFDSFGHEWDQFEGNWIVFCANTYYSNFGDNIGYQLPGDEGFSIFDDDDVRNADSIFLQDEGYFDVE